MKPSPGLKPPLNDALKESLVHDFSQNTTLHGIRYVLEPDSTVTRKVMWLCLLICGTAILVVQVTQKINEFNANPISTVVKMQYPPEMHFPAVAICNTNQYRISFMTRTIYDAVTEIYETDSPNVDIDFDKYQGDFSRIQEKDSREFLQKAAHDINRMILKCTWPDGKPCSAKDFQTITTDFGVCYAINTDQHPIHVDSSGGDAGLKLLINVEDYERLNGPTTSVGLKMVIFDQSSLPLVNYHGFDLAPGYLTQIGFNFQVYQKIHVDSGGTCVAFRPLLYYKPESYSMETCKMDKLFEAIRKKCNCLPHNIPASYDAEARGVGICSAKQHFKCAINVTTISPEALAECKENCTSVKYRVQLSMSSLPLTLSRFENQIRDDFATALEQRSRHQSSYARETQKRIDNLIQADARLRELRLDPNKATFLESYDRLKEEIPCLKIFMDSYTEIISKTHAFNPDNQWWSDQHVNQLSCDVLFQIADVMWPAVASITCRSQKITAATQKTQNRTFEWEGEVNRAIKAARELIGYFHPSKFQDELRKTILSYEEIFQLMELYQRGDIWKEVWANVTKRHYRNFIKDKFDPEYSKNLERNLKEGLLAKLRRKSTGINLDFLKTVTESKKLMKIVGFFAFNQQKYLQKGCMSQQDQQGGCMGGMEGGSMEGMDGGMGDGPDHGPGGGKGGGGKNDECQWPTDSCEIVPPTDAGQFISDLYTCMQAEGGVLQEGERIVEEVMRAIQEFNGHYDKLVEHLEEYSQNFAWTESFYSKNILKANIYFKDLSIETVRQERRYDIWSLACDIGGTLGLFLGASILTLFEIIDLIIHQLFWRTKKNFNKTKAHPPLSGRPSYGNGSFNESGYAAPPLY